MRPVTFSTDLVRQFLRRNRVGTLRQLKQMLGTEADITVFRKLKELSYHTSYSHRGQFYTLAEIADFDEKGLWTFDSVWFSRHGTLLHTVEAFVQQAPAGYFAAELEELLHVPAKEPLLQLVRQGRIQRQPVSGLYLYCATDSQQRRQQLRARRARLQPTGVADSVIKSAPISGELRAAIILFWSLLDEQQRRLYAGLESLKLGSGGDQQIADFLQLDPHTVAKGRRQLLAQDVRVDRIRKAGAGRKPAEKKRPKS
jgi:hypothetical protein